MVHDFGDDYHMSEEERLKKNRYYEVFAEIRKCKHKYRKIEDYIKTFRKVYNCIRVVAEDNGIYDPDEFVAKVLSKDIEIFGLSFPKYIGKDKKTLNWEMVLEYILNSEKNPRDLVKKTILDNDDTDLDNPSELFDEETWNILNSLSNEEDVSETYFNPEDETFIERASDKENKKFIKSNKELMFAIKDFIKEERKLKSDEYRLQSFVYSMTSDDFDYISDLDKKRGYESDDDIPEFKGDIMNDSDYKLFLYKLEEYEDNKIRELYKGKWKTKSEINEIEVKDALEEAGWNIRALYREKEEEKRLMKAYKRDKQREKELKRKLLQIQKRQDKRTSEKIEFKGKKKSKKKKKKDG
jgi:hypothetical protein